MSRLRIELMAIPLAFILGLWLLSCRFLDEGSAVGQKLARASYDLPYLLSGNTVNDSEVVIIYLDFRTYNLFGLDPLERFPRGYYAQLLNHLRAAGSRAAVFDIVFASGADEVQDAQLARAIRDHGNVYLAGEISQSSLDVTPNSRIQTTQLEKPFHSFLDESRGWGLASLPIDQDLVIRRNLPVFPEYDATSLSWSVASPILDFPSPVSGNWTYYYGPPFTIPHLSLGDFLQNPDSYRDSVKDKIILIGARPVTTGFGMIQDEFRSPFPASGRSNDLFHPGVEIHATQLLNTLRHEWLVRPDPFTEKILFLVFSIFIVCLLSLLRPWSAVIISVALVLMAFFISAGIFHGVGWWFAWVIPAAVQVPGGLVAAMTNRSLEWYLERRRILSAKRAADMRIREQASLLDQARDAILVCQLDGTITWFNRCASELYGWNSQLDTQSLSLLSTMATPDQFSLLVQEARSNGVWVGEIFQIDSKGRKITVDSRWTCLETPENILMINTDITQKKVMEEQLLRAQRMDTLGAIAGGVAHDLNNVLSPILMGVQLLKRQTSSLHDTQLLDAMESNTRRGAQMIHQLLAFSRGRASEKSAVDASKVLTDLRQFLVVTFPDSINVSILIPDDLWQIFGDTTQIHQILLNLCINARDAMPDGGDLIVAADNAQFHGNENNNGNDISPCPDGLPPGRYVAIMVSDSGSGIDPEIQKNVFQPFFSTKPEGKGTGLGLANVLNIVTNHKGTVRLQSEPGQGTTFEVFLPAAASSRQIESTIPRRRNPEAEGADISILVVVEEVSFRELIHGYLSECGFDVWTAGTGAEALSLLTSAGSLTPSLVILNSSLFPLTLSDAWQSKMTDSDSRLPLIIVQDTDSPEITANGTDPSYILLCKPFTMEQLLNTIVPLVSSGD